MDEAVKAAVRRASVHRGASARGAKNNKSWLDSLGEFVVAQDQPESSVYSKFPGSQQSARQADQEVDQRGKEGLATPLRRSEISHVEGEKDPALRSGVGERGKKDLQRILVDFGSGMTGWFLFLSLCPSPWAGCSAVSNFLESTQVYKAGRRRKRRGKAKLPRPPPSPAPAWAPLETPSNLHQVRWLQMRKEIPEGAQGEKSRQSKKMTRTCSLLSGSKKPGVGIAGGLRQMIFRARDL